MRRAFLGVLLFGMVLAGGCSDDDSAPPASTSSQPGSPDAEISPTESEGDEPVTGPAPSVAGTVLPDALIGVFRGGPAGFFTFYDSGDEICTDSIGTDQNCYAVRDSQDQASEPIEIGVVAVDGDVLRWVPTQDPNAACVGVTNEAQWAKTAAGVTITPTTDCHGDKPIKLVRVS